MGAGAEERGNQARAVGGMCRMRVTRDHGAGPGSDLVDGLYLVRTELLNSRAAE